MLGRANTGGVAFDIGEWLDGLNRANPWLPESLKKTMAPRKKRVTCITDVMKAISTDDAAFEEARRKACLERYQKGKETWNAWASLLIQAKLELEQSNKWRLTKELDYLPPQGLNDETKLWLSVACCDFQGYNFPQDANFHSFIFPGDAVFMGCRFTGQAIFEGAEFINDARFQDSEFNGMASFEWVKIFGSAWFGETTFKGNTRFVGARFEGDVGFPQVTFEVYTTFSQSIFSRDANFSAIHCERAFNLANSCFSHLPNFIQAHFKEAPLLDSIRISSDRGIPGHDSGARWRALRRLAIQGHDIERELDFFAREISTLRGLEHQALPNFLNLLRRRMTFPQRFGEGRERRIVWRWTSGDDPEPVFVWPGGARYWVGLLYQFFSDFGRSIVRPLIWLGVSIAIFALVYLGFHFAANQAKAEKPYNTTSSHWLMRHAGLLPFDRSPPPKLECLKGTGSPLTAAAQLSFKKSLLFIGWEQSEKINQYYACLYGVEASYRSAQKGTAFTPAIPDRVFVWSLFQTLISAVLIFLFLLAVRNHFKIK